MLATLYDIQSIDDHGFVRNHIRYNYDDSNRDYIGSDIIYEFRDGYQVSEELLDEIKKDFEKSCEKACNFGS